MRAKTMRSAASQDGALRIRFAVLAEQKKEVSRV
jgi:hypothetical protein